MKKILTLLLVMAMLISFSACAQAKTYIAYTVYPIGYIIERIAGSRLESISIQDNVLVQVASLVDDYETILEDTSYFFYIGDLEPYLDLYEEEITATGVTFVDLSELNAIYKFQRYTLVYVDGVETYIESSYYNSSLFDVVDVNELDLSLWIDPIGMLSMAERIYSTLASNYAEAASEFLANYESLREDLISLDAAYQELSQRLKNNNQTIKIVTMTPNFNSWQKAYGFQVYPVCLSKYGALPTDDQLEVIKQRIIADGVQYIAYEPNMTDEMIELFNELESELGLTRISLNNLSSLTPSQIASNKDYLSLMYENLNVLENLTTSILSEAEAASTTSGTLDSIAE